MPQPLATDAREQLALSIATLAGAERGCLAVIRQKYAEALPLLSAKEKTAASVLISSLQNSSEYFLGLAQCLGLQTFVNTVEGSN
jgi:hypothetical protein